MELDLEDFNKNVKVVPQNQPLIHLKPNPKLKVITQQKKTMGVRGVITQNKKRENPPLSLILEFYS